MPFILDFQLSRPYTGSLREVQRLRYPPLRPETTKAIEVGADGCRAEFFAGCVGPTEKAAEIAQHLLLQVLHHLAL